MNQLAIDKLPNPDCADSMKLAHRELAAFFGAVTKLFGTKQAELSAEDWLHEVAAACPLPSSSHEWRRITLKASTRLAKRVNPQAASQQLKRAYAAEACQ